MRSGLSNTVARVVTRLSASKSFWFFVGLFSVAMLIVFSEVLPKWVVTSSPDDSPFYPANYQVQLVEYILAGKVAFSAHRLLLLFDPLAIHEFAYVFDQFVFALALAYYLRTQRLSRLAAYGGGLFGAFSGYILTLFCAGHLGGFHNFAAVFWSLGLLNRCFERRRLFYFAMLGCVMMWGQPWQPDVWMLFAGIFAVYALWRFWIAWRKGMPAHTLFAGVAPRFLLTLVVAGLVGATGIRQVFTETLAGRDKQIAEASRMGGQKHLSAEQEAQKAFDRWIFATGWSLPPEDCAEFLVPGIFGNDSLRAPYPYWGRLGQPYAFQPGKMMPNYRQHTIYLGLVSLVLACFGVFAWLTFKRTKVFSPRQPAAGCRLPTPTSSSDLCPAAPDYSDVPFWAGVWLVCLVLAMGRYTPVYKLFYAVPYMDYLRAPVKFLHFTEVATALLAGFGLDALLADRTPARLRRGFLLGVGVLAVALGLTALLFTLNGAACEKHIAGLGLGQAAAALRGYAVYNCWRAAGIAAAVAALFWVAAKRAAKGQALTVAVACLMALGVADLSLVARRFVIPVDVQPFHETNLVIHEMQKRTGGRPANVANYVTRNVWGQDWFNTALGVHGFSNLIPDASDPNAAVRPFAVALQDNPLRFWQVLGVRFVMLPRQQAEPLVRQGVLAPVGEFELGAGTVRRAAPGRGNAIVLAESRQAALPSIHFAWAGGVAQERQADQTCQKDQTLVSTDAPPPAAPSARPPQPMTFMQTRGERGVFVTKGETDAPEPGLLVWNERYSPDLVARIDGNVVPVHQADGLWCAIPVPSGRHQITVRMRYQPLWNLIAAGTSLLVVLAGLAGARAKAHRNGMG